MRTWYGNNRVACDVLEEMRVCNKTRNYAPLLSLIEEMQVMANRMEAGLSDLKDAESLRKDISKLKKELRVLEDKKEAEDV